LDIKLKKIKVINLIQKIKFKKKCLCIYSPEFPQKVEC